MKPALQLRQSQQLLLTPQLQQAIKLLQLSTLEINQEAARLLDENPLLERIDDNANQTYSGSSDAQAPAQENSESASSSESPAQDSQPEWGEANFSHASGASPDDEDDGYQEVASERPNLREHLLWQLNMCLLDERDKKIISLLIDALDENAYLSQPLEEIVEIFPEELDITLDDLETALVQLQHLDAPGIGARDLRECLTLQLQAIPEDVPGRDMALRIVGEHLDLLAARDFAKLKRLLRCDDDALRTAQDLIVHLQPKPGMAFEHRAADYVVPDVLVEKVGGIWKARLNPEAMPRLRINQVYANILQQRGDASAQGMATQLQEARWFIKNLQQRFETILRVAQAIADYLRDPSPNAHKPPPAAVVGFDRRFQSEDYAAEIANLRAAKPQGVFFFLPGGMGVNFVKQYAQAGLTKCAQHSGQLFTLKQKLPVDTGIVCIHVFGI